MTLLAIVDEGINRKINENEIYLRYIYFEVRIKKNLSKDIANEYLRVTKIK